MSRVLVTGVSGFTGPYLVERLVRDGHEVHGLTRDLPLRPVPGLSRLHQASLDDVAGLETVVSEVRPERVVHLAAISYVGHDDVAAMYATNVVGTRNLLSVLARSQAPVERVAVASSANVYGNRGGVLEESDRPAPANDYGVTKLAAEHVAALFADRLPIIVTRPFNYTGVGQSPDFLVAKMVAHARRRAPVIELGNLDVARDISDVRTVADCYARLLDAPDAVGRTVNISSGSALSLRAILDLVSEKSGHRPDVRVNPAFVRRSEVTSLCGSRALLESLIGEVGGPTLAETIGWMVDHRD